MEAYIMNSSYKKKLSIDNTLGKIPPMALDLEEAVLGAIMIEADAFKYVVDILKEESFYKDTHQKIFAAQKQLFEQGHPIDLLTVSEQLKKNKHLEEVGGAFFVTQLTQKVASAANIEFHAYIIQQKFIQRQFIQVSQEIQQKAFDEDIDIDDLIDFSNDRITKIIEDSNSKDSVFQALRDCLVTADEEIKEGEVIFSIIDGGEKIPVFTKGNISTITGKAKSRKTFFLTMVCAAIIVGNLFEKFLGKTGAKMVYFDTEQGRKRTQKILRRIIELTGCKSPNIEVFSLRSLSPAERVKVIDIYFERHKPEFAIIDGIRDLITDINDPEQATEISTRLMKWSEIYDCHICTVLHQNKADTNARGHVGTEMVNKSESVISANKPKGDDKTTIECENMRGLEFESFQFYVNENGLPVLDGFVIAKDEETTGEMPF
jgi:hypothetical protein